MGRLVPWLTGWAVLAVAGVSGCMITGSGESSAQVHKQASLVSTVIGNSMGMGRITEAGLIQIVESDGGGYVTAITRSGQAGTPGERTTVHAVLWTSTLVQKGPIDEMGPVSDTAAVLCYRFTVGYYPYQVWQAQEPCPPSRPAAPGGFATTAAAEASRIQAAEDAIAELPEAARARVRAAPGSLSQAARLLGLDRRTRRVTRLVLPVTAGEFAAGRGRAALALRLRTGGCVYLSLPDDPEGGGLPGPWLSPVHAPCTGAAALAASGWLSVNPTLGG